MSFGALRFGGNAFALPLFVSARAKKDPCWFSSNNRWNGLQFGLLLFLLAAGLTLVFGIMDFVNLAHGSLYMMGAIFRCDVRCVDRSFVLGVLLALGATLLLGMALEFIALRHLYGRDHLDQVLATFGLILFFTTRAADLGSGGVSRCRCRRG